MEQISQLKKSAKPDPMEHPDTQKTKDDSAFLRTKLDEVTKRYDILNCKFKTKVQYLCMNIQKIDIILFVV